MEQIIFKKIIAWKSYFDSLRVYFNILIFLFYQYFSAV